MTSSDEASEHDRAQDRASTSLQAGNSAENSGVGSGNPPQGSYGEKHSDTMASAEEPSHDGRRDGDATVEAPVDDVHDPEGFDVAIRVAHQLSGLLPPARTGPTPRRRRARVHEETRSGAAPDPRDPQPLGAAMERLVRGRGWHTELGLRLILARWAELVGPANAQHSAPESYHGRVLVVRAESSTWASALRTIAPQLVAELNTRLGEGSVVRVDVRGPGAPSWKHGPRSVPGRGPRDTYG